MAADWTNEMLDQSTRFYLENYVRSFVMEDVCDAYAQIPQVWAAPGACPQARSVQPSV